MSNSHLVALSSLPSVDNLHAELCELFLPIPDTIENFRGYLSTLGWTTYSSPSDKEALSNDFFFNCKENSHVEDYVWVGYKSYLTHLPSPPVIILRPSGQVTVFMQISGKINGEWFASESGPHKLFNLVTHFSYQTSKLVRTWETLYKHKALAL